MRVHRQSSLIATAAILLLVMLTAVACNGDEEQPDGDGQTSTLTVTASPNLVNDQGRFFSISEVGFGNDGYVMLTNFTDQPATLAGLYVCQAPDCVELPDEEVKKGETAIVAMGDGEGFDEVVVTDAELKLAADGGEVGLYASEDVEEADDIRAYVLWGPVEHDGTATAIEAGLWIEGSYVESFPEAERIYRSEDTDWVAE